MKRQRLNHYSLTVITTQNAEDVRRFFREHVHKRTTVTRIATAVDGSINIHLLHINTKSERDFMSIRRDMIAKYGFPEILGYQFDFSPIFDAGFAAGFAAGQALAADVANIKPEEVEHV